MGIPGRIRIAPAPAAMVVAPPAAAVAAAVSVAAFLVAGCGGTIPAPRYYVVDYEMDAPPEASPILDLVLGVEPFSTPPLYRDRRIAARVAEHEVVFYPSRYWAAVPGELVASRLVEDISRRGLARAVEIAPYASSPDWLLSGRVEQFEEVLRGGGKSVARLEMTVRLESLPEGRILREDRIAIEKPLPRRGPGQVAEAMSAAVREAGERIAALLRAAAGAPGGGPSP